MDLTAIIQAIAAIITPFAAAVGLLSRKPRLRAAIRENLALAEELDRNTTLKEHTPVSVWMHGRIVLDVAKLTGETLGTPKKPVPKGSVTLAAIFMAVFSFVTYHLNRNGFEWYSIFPGTLAALFAISIFGMVTDRELPPEDSYLPPGATPIQSTAATERIAGLISLAASASGNRFGEHGQAGVALRFFAVMREGCFEEGSKLADSNWLLCRVQSWLYNNQEKFGSDLKNLDELVTSLLDDHEPKKVWDEFIAAESVFFQRAWRPVDPANLGVASRERIVAKDYARVIMTPLGNTGGFYVDSPTMLPNAIVFIVHRQDNRWLVSSHIGSAPPTPGWPPAWWDSEDTVASLATYSEETKSE